MQSWQSMYEMAQDLASDSDSDNLDLLKRLTNIGYHKVEKKLGIYFTEKIRTLTTVTDAISGTSNQSYRLFPDFASLTDLYVTVGSTQYWATLIQDDELWRKMNSTTTSSTSNFLSHCFIRADRVELFPIPSSASTGTMIYRSVSKDLSADDYTTGTITTLANGGTAVTAASSTFTAAMVGRSFKVNDDGEWYKIGAYGTATTITLEEKYLGSAISAGTSAYTIGEMPNLPDDETQMLPVYFALWKYFLFRKNRSMANMYKTEYKDGLKESVADWSNRSSSGVLKDQFNLHRHGVINPNEYPESMA